MASPIYSDSHFLVDPRAVVMAYPSNGAGPHDGVYVLVVYIAIGGQLQEAYIPYLCQRDRDAAYAKIRSLREQAASSIALTLDLDADDEEEL